MTSLPDLLTTISRGPEATSPRLTHYDADGRIELSGKVLLNWAAKAANLLTTEYDAEPGTIVGLELPVGHWRAAYWALAAWWCGASLRLVGEGEPGPPLDVLITARPERGAESADVIAVTPAPLARRSPTPLPAGVVDEAAVLASYGDSFTAMQEPEPDDVALTGGSGEEVTFADLAPGAGSGTGPAAGRDAGPPRVLLAPPDSQRQFLLGALSAWAAGGSVIVAYEVDADAVERIASQEGATRRG